jgi:hypothetical protein
VRLVTQSAAEYRSFWAAAWHHLFEVNWTSLFSGLRQSLFNAVVLPRASHHVLLLGVPTLLHARRMLPPRATTGSGGAHAGLGGSVELLTSLVRSKGYGGLLVGAQVSLDILPYAAASVLAARALGYLLLGPSREGAERARIRTAYLRQRMQRRPSRSSAPRSPSSPASSPDRRHKSSSGSTDKSSDGEGGRGSRQRGGPLPLSPPQEQEPKLASGGGGAGGSGVEDGSASGVGLGGGLAKPGVLKKRSTSTNLADLSGAGGQ